MSVTRPENPDGMREPARSVADFVDVQRLRSERRLLESANDSLHRQHAVAQEEIRRLRSELTRATVALRRALAELDGVHLHRRPEPAANAVSRPVPF